MAVYVDALRRREIHRDWSAWSPTCRLFGDTLEELVGFARLRLGIPETKVIMKPGRFPHYLIVRTVRQQALEAGAVEAGAELVSLFEARAQRGEWDALAG